MMYEIFDKIRSKFPILSKKINGYPLIYFDSAASAQKPITVINAEKNFYKKYYASVHRGIHTLSSKATSLIENIRIQVAKFINASDREIIFVKGATEGINLVANVLSYTKLNKGDNIIITQMEHHSNIVPWQIIAKRVGIKIRIIPMTSEGILDLSHLSTLIDYKTKILSITHISNVLGTVNPIKKIIDKVKEKANVITIVDGSQAIMHKKVDVKKIGCDFYVFSGHKIYGPSGIGVLYGRKEILKYMPPWEGGGAMVNSVNLYKEEETIFSEYPWRFEAGTPNISGIIGLGAALSFFQKTCIQDIKLHEKTLIQYTMDKLIKFVPDIKIYGPKKRIGVISFNIGDYHAYDIGSFLDKYGIAIRTGHHCAMPIMNFYNVSSMCRLSFALYNNKNDVDYLISRLTYICSLIKNISK